MSKLRESFPLQWSFRGSRYGFSPSAAKARLRCYATHIPFTRKLFIGLHELSCGAGVIVSLDGFTDNAHDMIQALLDDPAFEVSVKQGFSASLSPTKKRRATKQDKEKL